MLIDRTRGLAAAALVGSLTNRSRLTELTPLLQGRDVRLLPVHALESEGVNEIPAALAELLSEWLSLSIVDSIVQSNTVGHTGASGFQRLANQALFVGDVESGRSYLLVDDFIGQGRAGLWRTSSDMSKAPEVTRSVQPS